MLHLILHLTLLAHTALGGEWPAAVARLEKAVAVADAADLKAIRAGLRGIDLESLSGSDQALVQYTIGYTNRALAFGRGTTEEERRTLLAEAASELEQSVVLDPANADAHALLGSVYGASISLNPGRTIELVQKSRKHLGKAMALAPNNPRVQFLHGTSAFHKPAEFGGGPEAAEPFFRKALELFGQEPVSKPWPNWGRFDSYVYLGQTLSKLQKREQARRAYEAALALVPESEYVRAVLIPRLNR